jgi:hypothetical protein
MINTLNSAIFEAAPFSGNACEFKDSATYSTKSWFKYSNVRAVSAEDNSIAATADTDAPPFFALTVPTTTANAIFGFNLASGTPFYKSTAGNEVYCSG